MSRPRQTVQILPVTQLAAHPGNIRDDLGDLTDMARSIREHGVMQPLTVTEHPDRPDVYVVLDGHRRLSAALKAGETKVPVIIRHGLADVEEQTIIMLVTGIHRRELSAVERAKAYGRLHSSGLSMSEIGRRVGVTPSTISYYLNLLHLDDTQLEQIEDGDVTVGEAIAQVRESRQAERVAAAKPLRGRPPAYFGIDHPQAPVVARRCRNRGHQANYGGVGCGPCWEAAIRAHAIATSKDDVA